MLGTAVLCAALLASAACSDGHAGSNGARAPRPIDVCAIVSRDEAAVTVGGTVRNGEPSVANFSEFTCQWQAEDGFGEISVEVRAGDPKRFTEFYEYGDPGEPVEDIGERAEWDDVYGLEVLTQDYFVGVFTVTFSLDDAERQRRSITLAQEVLGRLPSR
jgi:hypothetical protein